MDEFMEIGYTGRIKRNNQIFDTTDEEKAKEEGIYSEKMKYKPKLVTKEDQVVEGVLEALKDMEEGEEREIEVPPEKAYGERDPSKIDMVPKRDFEDTDVTPVPGMRVVLDGKPAKIQTVSGGRVRVDFNNPLSGKELKYELKLNKIIKDDLDKSRALASDLTGFDEEEIDIKEKDKEITIKIPLEDEDKVKELEESLKEEIKETTKYEEVNVEIKEKEEEEE